MLGPGPKSLLIPAEELLKNVPALDLAVAVESYCYLTTTGRVSGQPREIEIWFGLDGATVYLLSGGGDRSNWVRNLQRDPAVTVRIAGTTWPGRARIVEDADEDERARTLLVDKYTRRYSGNLDGWRRRSLPVAIDLEASDD
jgi:deazaflavin-dependent oxidoreductase (nitroreductase family)